MVTIPKTEEFERITGFDYIKNLIDPKTPFGQKFFKHLKPLSYEHISQHLSDTELIIKLIRSSVINEDTLHDLECVIDISNSVERLKTHQILDEIELFEIKNYALVIEKIRESLKGKLPNNLLPPSLENVVFILDPEGLKLPTFYIYDAYSEELKTLRKKKRELQKQESTDETALIEITQRELELERQILQEISEKLSKEVFHLSESIEKIKYLDVIIAKARLALELGLTKPTILHIPENEEDYSIVIEGMFNPKLKAELEKKSKNYQPVDIRIDQGVTVIVGANMSGKSVVLRTIALIQYMAQLGFFVPALKCRTVYLKNICIVAEDYQRPLSGLSSFGSEMLMINETFRKAKEGYSLVLIDEPARTTNPYEGSVIVNTLVREFGKLNVYTLIVTHFDDIIAPRRLRVKGLKEENLKQLQNYKPEELINHIQDYIDYSLIETTESSVPKEATKIMEILGIDKKLVPETGTENL